MELESAPGWIKPRWKSIQLVPGKFGKWCFCTESKPRQATKSHCWCDDRSFPINHGDPRRGPKFKSKSISDGCCRIMANRPSSVVSRGGSDRPTHFHPRSWWWIFFAPHEDPWAGCFVRFRPYRMQKSIMTKFLMTETNPGLPQEEDAPDFPKRSWIKI